MPHPAVDIKNLTPKFVAPSNYKDAQTIANWEQRKREEWQTNAGQMPYLATFAEVFVAAPTQKLVQRWIYHPPEEGKKPVSLQVRDWLLTNFPEAWPWDMQPGRKPSAILLGFDVRLFLKILGLECSMPAIGKPLPATLWYGQTDHRDIAEAVMPKDCLEGLTLPQVLALRGISLEPAWLAPHLDAERDVRIITMLAVQLGFV